MMQQILLKIIYFYKNPKMRKKFAENNRKFVVSNYSIKYEKGCFKNIENS